MEHVKLLDKLVSKTAPGRSPDFTKAHVLYTFIILKGQRMGRKQLSEELRLGEGTVRTMLNRLQDEKFIEISRSGVSLSRNGQEYLNKVMDIFMWKPLPNTEITVDDLNWAVLIRGASDRVRYGVEQRDQALIHGASGATTMIYQGDAWFLPGIKEEIEEIILKSLDDFNPAENDVAVIGTSKDGFSAILGALAAAIDLMN
jgi:DNA-binding PadR family transcriptional regulator